MREGKEKGFTTWSLTGSKAGSFVADCWVEIIECPLSLNAFNYGDVAHAVIVSTFIIGRGRKWAIFLVCCSNAFSRSNSHISLSYPICCAACHCWTANIEFFRRERFNYIVVDLNFAMHC